MILKQLKKRDYIAIVIILIALVLLTVFPFGKNSFVAKFVSPVQKLFRFAVEDAGDMLDERERAGYSPETGIYMISNFESVAEISRWRKSYTEINLSNKFSSEGKSSCLIKFLVIEDKPSSKVFLQSFLNRWSNFKTLAFEIYNPSLHKFRVILQIKDRTGKRFKKNLNLAPNTTNYFTIPISDIAAKMNTDEIVDFNLFLWKPKRERKIFLDNLRLLTADAGGEGQPAVPEVSVTTPSQSKDKNYVVKKPRGKSSAKTTTITVTNPHDFTIEKWHCTHNVEFAPQEIDSSFVITLKDKGKNLPLQFNVTDTWDDGSYKTAKIDFQTDFSPNQEKQLALVYGKDIFSSNINEAINIKENDNEIIINTGPLKLSLSKNHFAPFKTWKDLNHDGIFSEKELISLPGNLIVKSDNTFYKSANDYLSYFLQIEEIGPLRVLLKAEGMLRSDRGDPLCKFITYIQLYYNKSHITVLQKFDDVGNSPLESLYMHFSFVKDFTQLYSPNTGVQMHFPIKLVQINKEKCAILSRRNRVTFDSNLSKWFDVSNKSQGTTLSFKSHWDMYQEKKFEINSNNFDIYIIKNSQEPYKFSSLIAKEKKKFENNKKSLGFPRSFDYEIYYHDYDPANIKPFISANTFFKPITITTFDE